MLKPIAAVPMRTHDFKLLVIQKLTLLETLMTSITGNGQPGRLQQLEDKVRSHDHLFWLLTGAGIVLGWVLERLFN
jgi:hypothetical protein